jgi:hypothetical protein
MPSALFKCPSNGMHTHAWIAEDAGQAASPGEYITVSCPACRGLHHFDPATGTLLGGETVRLSAVRRTDLEGAAALPSFTSRQLPPVYRRIALAALAIAIFSWILLVIFQMAGTW